MIADENVNDNENKKHSVYLAYEIDNDCDMRFIVNQGTDMEQIVNPKTIYSIHSNKNIKIFVFAMPDNKFLKMKEKNSVVFELTYSPMIFTTANYFSAKYSFFLKDPFSHYFMFGMKFQKNENHMIYNEPPGKPIDGEISENFYFFEYIMEKYLDDRKKIPKENKNKLVEKLIEFTLIKLNDLIEIFKTSNLKTISNHPKATILFLKFLDDLILSMGKDSEIQEVYLFILPLLGIFNFDFFLNKDYSLNSYSCLFCNVNKLPLEIFSRFEKFSNLKEAFLNGLYILTCFSVKDGSGIWLDLLDSKFFNILFDQQFFYLRVNDYIRRSGTGMKNKNKFDLAKNFLIKIYQEQKHKLKNPQQSYNAVLRNISILSVNKENLIDTLLDFYDLGNFDYEKFKAFKEDIRKKKWQSLGESNLCYYILKLKKIIESLKITVDDEFKSNQSEIILDNAESQRSYEYQTNPYIYNSFSYKPKQRSTYSNLLIEFEDLLYDLSLNIKYIFAILKVFEYNKENLRMDLVKKAMENIYAFSIEDYSFIVKEIQSFPDDLRKEIIDINFYDKIKSSLKKISLPYDNFTKEALIILLLSRDLFPSGTFEIIKDFVRNKPSIADLIFIVKNIIVPQKIYTEPESFKEIFIYIKNYLMSNTNEIDDLIHSFSLIISTLDCESDQESRRLICDDFWKTINQRYSPEVFLGLSQIFNEPEKDTNRIKIDSYMEISYINYVKSIIESINTDLKNFEKVNQFFNSICITLENKERGISVKERVISCNNKSTEKIIISILDILCSSPDSKQAFKSFLLENPSKDNFWYKLIKSRGKETSYLTHPYLNMIFSQVSGIFKSIENRTISVSEMIIISKQNTSMREALVSYIKSIIKVFSSQEILEIVESGVKYLNDNLQIISEVDTFFNLYGAKIDNANENINLLKDLKNNYNSTYIRDFILPNEIMKMKDHIKTINQWSETIIFSNVMDSNLQSFFSKNKPINNQDIAELEEEFIGDFEELGSNIDEESIKIPLKIFFEFSKESINEIKFFLSDLIRSNDLSKITLKSVMKYFKGLGLLRTNIQKQDQSYQIESRLISKFLGLINYDANVIEKILKTFYEISIYVKFCSFMNKLDYTYKFSLSNISLYQEFLGLIENIESDFVSIINSIDKISEIRRKYNSKIDLDNILFEISENKELIEFLIHTPDEDIRNMVDAADEHGDSFIRVQTIRDLLIVGSFMRSIKIKEYTNIRENNPLEEEFISRIVSIISQNISFQNVEVLINTCGKQFLGIKHLHNELSNREEASKIKAKEISKESKFDFFFNLSIKSYELNVFYGKNKKILFKDLCDLRDRILLLLYNEKDPSFEEDTEYTEFKNNQNGMIVENDNSELILSKVQKSKQSFRQVLSSFLKVVDFSEKLIFILKEIYQNGYPIHLNKKIDFINCDSTCFSAILEEISSIDKKWKEDLKDAYIKFYPLTYYHGIQFWQLESIFTHDRIDICSSKGYYLLRYADPSININNIITSKYKYNDLSTPKERIFFLGEALIKIIKPERNGSIEIKSGKINKNYLKLKNSNIIFANPPISKIYQYLLSLHFSIETSLPFANQIFYCTKSTTFHELASFLYRFIYCPVKRLFSIIRIDDLNFELQNFLVDKINMIQKTNLIPNICLISSNKSSFINSQFTENSNLFYVREFDIFDESIIKKVLKSLNINSTIITSDDTGAGKSSYIRKKFESNKEKDSLQYISLPLLDTVSIDNYTEKLFELNKYTRKKFIHMTISGCINEFQIIDYILFKFIFIGCLKHDIYVGIRNREDILYLEISNSYNDYIYNSLSILPLFPNEEKIIAKDYISMIDMGKYIFDPIQIVCNYLYQYEAGTINHNDLNPQISLNCRIFNKDEGLSLIKKYFINNNPNCTFRQINIFISILADQLNKFSNNFYFTCENLRYIQDITLSDVRSRIMNSLLLMTEEFTIRSVKATKESQNLTNSKVGFGNILLCKENLNNYNIDEIDSSIDILSWSKSNHFLMMFHEDGYCITPVYRQRNQIPQAINQLIETQKGVFGDYQKMSHYELLQKLVSIVGGFFCEELFFDSDYVMTADNFLKMLLIIIRARCNIPIVIMGETGCGKTSLVRFLATRILNERFEVINFHAGIKESQIIDKINEIKLKAYELMDAKIWVFLDEINTCDHLGLITEIMTQNSLMGESLPFNIIFIAACNPYKIRNSNSEVGLIKQRVVTQLVYRVHPLPDSLLDYAWDYGSLTDKEEALYIENILRNITGELKEKVISLVVKSQIFIRECEDKYSVSLRDVSRFKILHEWFYKILEEKNRKEDISMDKSKSWNDSKNNNSFFYADHNFSYYSCKIKYKGKTMVARKALILSLFLCYYNRISHNKHRAEYKKIIIRSLSISENDLDEMIYEEQKDILTRMELPPAIAINKALLENVFTLMVCVINKTPLFICGKPGCSKSLAVQLLVANLRGQDSNDNFFKNLPRILAIPYQGSDSSTSEGIEKIFDKAHNVLKNADKSILPLIVFDEIGLAEISKNNPLKVLHSLLEPENAVIAFVGISNWRLDASKMNRAIYLARPDPDLEDLECTALSIFEYYNKEPRFDEKVIMKGLAKTYFEFKKEQCDQGYPDFHGTRDFYSLIKQVTKQFSERINEYIEMKYSIVKDAFNRNFGGLNNSINSIHRIFAKNMNILQTDFDVIHQSSMMELVKDNLKDKDSRFLLLFTNGESASYILDNYLKNDLKERVFLIGSEFEGDKNKDEHSFRLLSDIILYMESGSSVILKNLDQIYGSLYDLFNQNFMIVGNKKNCRIALGSTNNPMCFVHNNFHCVVLVDIKNLNRMDPPFLNRFEKQVLTFDSILTDGHREIVKELNTWIDSITKIPNINQENSIYNALCLSDLIVSYNEEFCASLALLHYNEEKSKKEIIQKCIYDIISVCNINLIIFSVLSEMYLNWRNEVINCHEIFFDHQSHDSLSQYVSSSYYKNIPDESLRLIVFTYSNILDEIQFRNLNISDENDVKTSIINLAEIKTDKEFEHRFKIFLNNKESEWMLIKINALNENSHIPIIKFKAEKLLNEHKKNLSTISNQERNVNKNVIIIVYLSKINKKVEKTDDKFFLNYNINHIESNFLSGWNQITIDCLNGGQITKLKNLLNFTTLEVVKSNLDTKTISEIIFSIYLKFNFCPYNSKDSKYIKPYMTDIIRKIETNSEFFELITNKCLEYLCDPKKKLLDWKMKICCDNKIVNKSINTYHAIKLFVADILEEPLLKIIHYLETESAMNSFFLEYDEKMKLVKFSKISIDEILKEDTISILKTVWKDIFIRQDIGQIYPYSVIQSMIINPVQNLNFPFSRSEISNISLLIKDSIENIRNLETRIETIDLNLIYEIELENVKKILKSSNLFKIISDLNYYLSPSQERSLQFLYISDILTYFITVELKIQSIWKDCLGILCENFLSFENENISTLFVFLWKNKKILNSIFCLLEEMLTYSSKKKDIFIFEEMFKNSDIYPKNINEVNKRKTEIILFNTIFSELSKVLLSYLYNFDKFDSITNSFALILNKFISTITDYSLETKFKPEVLDLLIIVNECLKILCYIFVNNNEEISARIYDLFFENKDSIDINKDINSLTDYSFIPNLLNIIDIELRNKKLINKTDLSMPVDDIQIIPSKNISLDNSYEELNLKIVNSKIIIFECAITKEINQKIKGVIISNILKDNILTNYSSMVFNKLFSNVNIDESFQEIMNNFKIKDLIDNSIKENKINSFDNIFFSFLSDLIRKYFTRPAKNMDGINDIEQLKIYLNNNYENYSYYWDLLDSNSKFENILAFAGLKHYIQTYGEYLIETRKLNKDSNFVIKINKHLENNDKVSNEAIRNYLLKSLMIKLGGSASSLSRLNLNEMGINWINNNLFEKTDNALGLSMNLTGLDTQYQDCSELIIKLINEDKEENINNFRELLKTNSIQNKSKNSFEIRLSVIQFFINKFYLSFSNPNFTESFTYNQMMTIFEKIKDCLKECLGQQSFIFITKLLTNFSKDRYSFFKIDSKMDQSKIGMLAFIMQLFNLLINSSSSVEYSFPYIQIFKNHTDNYSTIINNLENFKNIYIPGGIPDYDDEAILDKIKHVNENFEIYGTQLGLYECSCGYLYTIGDCTKPYYKGDCPICKEKIGGTGHVLEARPGHICLINKENRIDPNRKQLTLDHLFNKLRNTPGYQSKMSDEISLQYSLRGLSAIGFRFFNFINNSIIYMLIELGIINNKEFLNFIPNNQIKNYSGIEYLKSHLNCDKSKLDDLLNVKDTYIFMMLVLSDIQSFICSNFENKDISYNLKSLADRENYENFIQSNFITPKLEKIQVDIQDYKSKYSLDKDLSFIEILDESFNEKQILNLPYIEYMRIFRVTKIGNWEDLKSEFLKISLALSSNEKKHHQFLKIIIHRFDDFILLSNLYPIILFTNYMLNLFNYRLSRQEAKEKKIKDITKGDPIAEKLFLDFSYAWDNIYHRCIQFSCKTLPPVKSINSDMPLSFVLLDDRELGYGMYMASALQQLGQIQNEIIEAIVYLIKEDTSYQIWSNVDTNKYSIQKISSHDIIMHETNIEYIQCMTNNLARFYDVYNPNYGGVSSVIYNFEKIEQELAKIILTNKKMLNYEDLSKIQYKFELLSINNKNSNLLNDIKNKVIQKIFSPEEKNILSKTLERIESQNLAIIHQLFSSLEIILCNLRYTSNFDNSLDFQNISVSKYILNIPNNEKISFLLKETEPICSVKLKNIISLYELIEEKIFIHILEYISPEYKIDLKKEALAYLNKFLTYEIVSQEKLIRILQKFIIRCLVAYIEPKFPIKEYLIRSDFWDIDIEEEIIDKFYEKFPEEILIANSLPLLDYITESKNKIDKQKSENSFIDINYNNYTQARMELEKRKNKYN